jgi:hypothetical protein
MFGKGATSAEGYCLFLKSFILNQIYIGGSLRQSRGLFSLLLIIVILHQQLRWVFNIIDLPFDFHVFIEFKNNGESGGILSI